MKRILMWVGVALLALLILGPMALSRTDLGAVMRILPTGWWGFLERNLPQVEWNWNVILMVPICSAIVLWLGHWLLGGIHAQAQRLRLPEKAPVKPWRWRWTITLFLGAWVLFVVAFGAAGVFRHTSWLMDYRQPWYEERLNPALEYSMVSASLDMLMMETDSDLKKTYQAYLADTHIRPGRGPMSESFNVIFFADREEKVRAYVIVPRIPQLVRKGYFSVVSPDDREFARPLAELENTIARLEAKFPLKK